jgi:hypothetical protein
MIQRATQLKLAVDIGSDPITGSVAVGEGTPTSFCGWIELVAAIEAARYDGGVGLEEPPLASAAAPAAPVNRALG